MTNTTVHGMGVLSNLDLLERAGYSTQTILEALGESRGSLLAGARVEWDDFARLVEPAIEAVGIERVVALGNEMAGISPELKERSEVTVGRHLLPFAGVGMPSRSGATHVIGEGTRAACARDALELLVRDFVPVFWPPLRPTFEDRGPGLAVVRLEIPAPLRSLRGYLEASAHAIAGFPRSSGLPAARVLDVAIDPEDRRASYFLELPDELERAPLGPLGDVISGVAVVGTLDIAELAGVDPSGWLKRHRLDRAQLMADAPVRWDAYRELAELCEERAGEEALRAAARSFAELTREIRPLTRELPDLLALYRALHGDAVEPFWGPLGPAVVERIRPGVLFVRAHVRAGLPGCPSLLRGHAGTLEGLTAHRDLAPARVRSMHVDAEGTTGTFVVELPEDPVAVAPHDAPHGALAEGRALSPDRIMGAMFRGRRAARARIVEELGVELASRSDVHAIAEVVLEGMIATLGADGAQVDLMSSEQAEPAPLRARGCRRGDPLVRTLEHGGERVGVLRVWTPPATTGETLAALDVVTPWIAVALGTTLERARHARALAEAEAAREGAERALEAVLTAHPGCAFVLDGLGRVTALSADAKRTLAADTKETLARLAGAVGAPSAPGFDVLPVRIGVRIDRIVIIERASGAWSFEERIARAAERWGLTPRQREALDRMARGMSNREIAQDLGCAEVTVESHLTAIYRRAAVGGRSQLAAKLATM